MRWARIAALGDLPGNGNQHPAWRDHMGFYFSGKFRMALEESAIKAEA